MINQYQNEIIEAITENFFYGLVIVDENSHITHLNNNYCHFLQVEKDHAIGKHVVEAIEKQAKATMIEMK